MKNTQSTNFGPQLELFIAQAEANLEKALLQGWRETTSFALPTPDGYERFLRPFEDYAGKILDGYGETVPVADIDAYVEQLRGTIIPLILNGLEPDSHQW